MEKTLFITRHYLCDNNGGANATKGFVHAFAKVCENMTLIYPEHDDEDNSSYAPTSCYCIPCFDKRSTIQKGLDVYRGRLHRLTVFVRDHLQNNKYNTIVIDHSLTAASLISNIKRSGAKVITIHHNVEKYYLKDNLPPLIYRFPMLYYSLKAEKNALLTSDLNLTLTENDAKEFAAWYPKKNLHLHNIGICEYRPIPEKNFEKKGNGNSFIITGSLCFKQSYEPIIEFMQKYYNSLIKMCPNCKLIIAGRNPTKELYAICQDKKNVEIIGNPIDMGGLLDTADYYICPINAGSGIKLRVTDGLKHGLPILCHEVSAVGYESFTHKAILFKYHDKKSFEVALNEMLQKKQQPDIIYDTFKNEFSVEVLAYKLNQVLQKENLI